MTDVPGAGLRAPGGHVNGLRGLACAALLLALAAGGCGKGVTTPGGDGNPNGGGWVRQASWTTYDLLAVSFADTLHGWAVGDYVILHTSDGGLTWVNQTQNATRPGVLFTGVSAADTGTCWVLGFDGSVQATSDGGRSWSLQASGVPGGSFYAISFADTTRGWVCGRSPTGAGALIRYTLTGGHIWSDAQTTGVDEMRSLSVSRPYSFRLMACGLLGSVATSQDGGATWTKAPATGTTQMLQAIAVVPGTSGMSAVTGGVVGIGGVLRTGDGGGTWQAGQPLPAGMEVRGAWMATFTGGWIVGLGSGHAEAAHTTDGGVTWFSQSVNWGLPLNAVHATDANHAWAVGDGGAIFMTRTAGN
jgi:photosystem II stability/assembly factor-like uncharacterized protein